MDNAQEIVHNFLTSALSSECSLGTCEMQESFCIFSEWNFWWEVGILAFSDLNKASFKMDFSPPEILGAKSIWVFLFVCFRFYSLFPSHEILSSEIFCLFCFYLSASSFHLYLPFSPSFPSLVLSFSHPGLFFSLFLCLSPSSVSLICLCLCVLTTPHTLPHLT